MQSMCGAHCLIIRQHQAYNPGLSMQLALFLGFLYPCYASYKALLTPGTADDHQARLSSPISCCSLAEQSHTL